MKILLNLWIVLIFLGFSSCKLLEKSSLDIIKKFSENTLFQLLGIKVNFDDKQIDIQGTFKVQQAIDILGQKVCEQLTYKGRAEAETQKVLTKIVWLSTDKENVKFLFYREKLYEKGNEKL